MAANRPEIPAVILAVCLTFPAILQSKQLPAHVYTVAAPMTGSPASMATSSGISTPIRACREA